MWLRVITYFYELMYMIFTSPFFRTIMLFVFMKHKLEVCYKYYKINKALEKMILAEEKQQEEVKQQQEKARMRKDNDEFYKMIKEIPNLKEELNIGRAT